MKIKGLFVLSIFLINSILSWSQSFSVSLGSNLNMPRMFHEMKSLPDGQMLIMGGLNFLYPNNQYLKNCELYSPQNNVVQQTDSMNSFRYSFMSVVLNSGYIMAIGGKNQTDNDTKTCEIYNTNTQTWNVAADLNQIHSGAAAVTLFNGKVLVAGGTTTKTELYDQVTQTWSYACDMYVQHGEGMSLTILENGNILAVGGKDNPSVIELYSPITNTWHLFNSILIYPRVDHAAILLKDGRVLLAGSSYASPLDSSQTEIIDPISMMVKPAAKMLQKLSSIRMEMLDNGHVLAFGLCEGLFGDTKIFQEYDVINNNWISQNYNKIGVLGCTMGRLSNGNIFIAGGNFNSGAGCTNETMIVSQQGYLTCVDANLDVKLNGVSNTNCYGKDLSITLSTTELGVIYTICIGENEVGTITGTGGNNVPFLIQSKYLTLGLNCISIKIRKNGCVWKKGSNTALMNMLLTNQNSTVIYIKSGNTYLCPGGSTVVLDIQNPLGRGNYLWNNGVLGNEIILNQPTSVLAQHIDTNGCYGLPSQPIDLEITQPTDVAAYSPISTACQSYASFSLNGYPSGGIWSGIGVTSNGVFSPSSVNIGLDTIYYNYCGYTASVNISVQNKAAVSYSGQIQWPTSDTLCGGANYMIPINATYGEDLNYDFYIGNSHTLSTQNPYYKYPIYYPGSENEVTFTYKVSNINYTPQCPTDTLIFSKKYVVSPSPKSVNLVLPDTVCYQWPTIGKIIQPQLNVFYYLSYDGNQNGNRNYTRQKLDTLIMLSPKLNSETGNLSAYAISSNACAAYPVFLGYRQVEGIILSTKVLGDVYYVGDKVNPITQSNANYFQWRINDSIYTSKNAPIKTYKSTCTQPYKLFAMSKFGCSDTVLTDIQIVEKPNFGNSVTCLFDSTTLSPDFTILKTVIDKNNNIIHVGVITRYDFQEYFTYLYHAKISKHNSRGELMWSITDSLSWASTMISGVTLDEDNNIYITGGYYSNIDSFGNISMVDSVPTSDYGHVFVAKISEYGDIKWFLSSYDPEGGPRDGASSGGGDIVYSNGKLFISARLQDQSSWKNQSNQKLPVENIELVRDFGIIEIDTSGSRIKMLASIGYQTLTQDEFVMCSFNDIARNLGYYEVNVIIVAPNLQVNKNGKLMVSGIMQDSILFDQTFIKSSNYSEFTGVIDTSKTGWESVRLESSLAQFVVDFNRPIPIYTDEMDKISVLNLNLLSDYKYVGSNNVQINNDEAFSTSSEGVLIKRMDTSGNLLWKRLLNNCSVNQLLKTNDGSQVIIVGTLFQNGLYLTYGNENLGLGSSNQSDVFAVGFDALSGNVLWAERLGSKTSDDYCFTAAISPCNDLVILGTRTTKLYIDSYGYYNEESAVGYEPICHNNDSIYSINHPYILKIPLSGVCNSNNCDNVLINSITNDFTTSGNTYITAYPNPTSDIIWVTSSDGQPCQKMSLKDIKGIPLFQQVFIDGKDNRLDVSSYPPGMYFLECTFPNYTSLHKICIFK